VKCRRAHSKADRALRRGFKLKQKLQTDHLSSGIGKPSGMSNRTFDKLELATDKRTHPLSARLVGKTRSRIPRRGPAAAGCSFAGTGEHARIASPFSDIANPAARGMTARVGTPCGVLKAGCRDRDLFTRTSPLGRKTDNHFTAKVILNQSTVSANGVYFRAIEARGDSRSSDETQFQADR
jgi:hypothetical protein